MTDIGATMALTVTVHYTGAIGFAEVFDCEVLSREDASGMTPAPSRLSLTVLPQDRDALAVLHAHAKPARLSLRLRLLREGEPYAHAAVTGFVAADGKVWQLESVRPLPRR